MLLCRRLVVLGAIDGELEAEAAVIPVMATVDMVEELAGKRGVASGASTV